MSFYDLVLTPAAATTPVSQKWREEEVWLSLHSANGNEHSSHQQYYFLTLQVKCQGHTRTLKKCYNTFKVRGDEKLLPQQWFICTLDLLFSSSPRTVTIGNTLPLQGHLHTTPWSLASSIRVKQPFVSFQLSNLERMPAALFWLSILTNKLRLLPREALSPGKFILTKNVRLKGEGQAKSLLKDISTGHCHHYWQNPKAIASASICSVSSSPTVIYSSWVSSLLHLHKVQKHQWIQISVNLAFKYYSSTYNSNGN